MVEVETLSESVKQATALGAKVLVPPQKLPDGDELAILHDPEGVPFGMFQPAIP
jgi:predicted enzyme related to lactoylglutathione lyase